MKRTLIHSTAALLMFVMGFSALAQGRRGSAQALTESAQTALTQALSGPDGEYAARARYQAILDKFGAGVLPYAHIIQAEENHIAALQQQCRNLGLPIPEDVYWGKVKAPETLAEAAEAGIALEQANVKMYEQLLPEVRAYPALVRVFTNLQAASAERHLPALESAQTAGGTVNAGFCRAWGGRAGSTTAKASATTCTSCLRCATGCQQFRRGWQR